MSEAYCPQRPAACDPPLEKRPYMRGDHKRKSFVDVHA